ncbi:MAG: hypothetical protein ACLSV2_13925 [Clostridium sp.]
MKNISTRTTLKLIVYGILWSIITLVIARVFTPLTSFYFKDVVFVEGLLMLVMSITSVINSKAFGMSFYILNQIHSQYISNKEFKNNEDKFLISFKNVNLQLFLSWIAIAIGGFINMLLIFVL